MFAAHFLELIIKPTLRHLELSSCSAEKLVLGTIWQESNGRFLQQIGSGTALGLIQMEPKTHNDIWCNYLKYRPRLETRICHFLSVRAIHQMSDCPPVDELITNLSYAVAMCRVFYLRVSEPLPKPNNLHALGSYWKRYYNTQHGAGSVKNFVESFPNLIQYKDD